jgi:hypothetical protein
MRYLKLITIMLASLVLTAFMGLAGCGEDHGRIHGERDRTAPAPRYDNDRHEERHDADRHEDRGGDSGHDQDEHGGR